METDGFETETDNFVYMKGDKALIRVTMRRTPSEVPNGEPKEKEGKREDPEPKPPVTASAPAAAGVEAREITNSIGMRLVRMPKRKFTMGSANEERKEVLRLLDQNEMRDWLKSEAWHREWVERMKATGQKEMPDCCSVETLYFLAARSMRL